MQITNKKSYSRIALTERLKQIIIRLCDRYQILINPENIKIRPTSHLQYGHYMCNVFLIASTAIKNINQKDLNNFINKLEHHELIQRVVLYPTGFLNLWLKPAAYAKHLQLMVKQNFNYSFLKPQKISIDCVSANPTGKMHIGHARHAAVGLFLTNFYKYIGWEVQCAYYINDAGSQINNLAITVFIHYHNLCYPKKNFKLYSNSYQSPILKTLAKAIWEKHHDKYANSTFSETKIDNLAVFDYFKQFVIEYWLAKIKQDLLAFDLQFDLFQSEQKLVVQQPKMLKLLTKKLALYEHENATWIKTTQFGDDKDRVLVRSDQTPTYLLNDLIFHWNRFHKDKFNHLLDIFGADHHGYVARMRSSLQFLGIDAKNHYHVNVLQLVKLVEDQKQVKLSKRAGNIISFDDLLKICSIPVAKFLLLAKPTTSELTLDPQLAKLKTEENLYWYCQYFNARCNSLFTQFPDFQLNFDFTNITHEIEIRLLQKILDFYEHVNQVLISYDPYVLVNYLHETIQIFSHYYHIEKIINPENKALTNARLTIIYALFNISKLIFSFFKIPILKKM